MAGGDYGLVDLVLDGAGRVVDFSACVPAAALTQRAFTRALARTHTHTERRTQRPRCEASHPTFPTPLPSNPDYFTHALWQRVVGHVALGATVEGGGGDAGCAGVRAWAACAARDAGGAGAGVAAVVVNFCGAEAALDFGAAAGGAPLGAERREWVLTPGDAGAGLASKSMRLNGALLALAEGYTLPPLPFVAADAAEPMRLPPHSYAFVSFPLADATACKA